MRKINEGFLSRDDVSDVLSAAYELRQEKSSIFDFGRSKKLSSKDIVDKWTAAGRPDDSRKLAKFLSDLGYERKEINQIFRSTFDTKHGAYDTGNSEIVTKLSKYIIDNGYNDEILTFLEHHYDYNLDDEQVTTEQIRTVFERIMHIERTEIPRLQREFEQQSLGRHRK